MYVESYPRCCGGKILTDFGYCSDNGTRYSDTTIEDFLRVKIKDFKRCGYAFIVIALNDEQDNPRKIILHYGFNEVGDFARAGREKDTKMQLYVLGLSDYKAPEYFVKRKKVKASKDSLAAKIAKEAGLTLAESDLPF